MSIRIPPPALRATAIALLVAALRSSSDLPRLCRAPSTSGRASVIAAQEALGGLAFDKAVTASQDPRDGQTWLVALHRGIIERIRDGRSSVVLDISDRIEFGAQWGLQDFALHPDFPRDRRVFVSYFAKGRISTVSSFRTAADGSFDPASEVVLLSEAQRDTWHPIGGLEFGPDGDLYVGWGFGGLTSDDPHALRGKMLRVDVDRTESGRPYAIPSDNPFVGADARGEIFATGLRNPWRFSFDPATGDLWLGDVGESGYEEIDRIRAGRSYGWPAWEGTSCRRPDECATDHSEPPRFVHSHSEMCAVLGGYVYRGRAIAALSGKYVYADACTGTIWALDATDDSATSEPVGHIASKLTGFARGADGELYVITGTDNPSDGNVPRGGFKIFKIVPYVAREALPAAAADERLSDTGCIGAAGFRSQPAGMISYGINLPPWEDGAETLRFVSIRLTSSRQGIEESVSLPVGSVVVKTYVVADRPVETQMLARADDGEWLARDFQWNADASDAVLVTRPKSATIDGRRWHFAGPEGCVVCHNTGAGMLHGLTISQLNREFDGENQIARLERAHMWVWSWKGKGPLPALARPDDDSKSLDARARAYLDVNCAHCHQPGGQGASVHMDLRRETPLGAAGICGRTPSSDFPQLESALLLSPGDPERSLIYMRLSATGTLAMPPSREVVDRAGTRLIANWIRAMTICPKEPPA